MHVHHCDMGTVNPGAIAMYIDLCTYAYTVCAAHWVVDWGVVALFMCTCTCMYIQSDIEGWLSPGGHSSDGRTLTA